MTVWELSQYLDRHDRSSVPSERWQCTVRPEGHEINTALGFIIGISNAVSDQSNGGRYVNLDQFRVTEHPRFKLVYHMPRVGPIVIQQE